MLYIYHSDQSKPPVTVPLLLCQVRPLVDDPRCFDLVSCEYFLFNVQDIYIFWVYMRYKIFVVCCIGLLQRVKLDLGHYFFDML